MVPGKVMAAALGKSTGVAECPGGCGQLLSPADFRRYLGFLEDDRVEARWRGGRGYFAGTISRIHEDGEMCKDYTHDY